MNNRTDTADTDTLHLKDIYINDQTCSV